MGNSSSSRDGLPGGFLPRDGTVQFYSRVNALLSPSDVVVDLGAGRGEWLEDPVLYRRSLRMLRGKVREVIGLDIDRVVSENISLDRSVVMTNDVSIDLEPASVDLLIADHTFEHVDHPAELASALASVLKPGGWLCARTPNRWGYIGLATSAIPNEHHVRLLRKLQPTRQAQDVFATTYKMNTPRAIHSYFGAKQWGVHVVPHNPEPSYFADSRLLTSAVDKVQVRLPRALAATWHIFAQRK